MQNTVIQEYTTSERMDLYAAISNLSAVSSLSDDLREAVDAVIDGNTKKFTPISLLEYLKITEDEKAPKNREIYDPFGNSGDEATRTNRRGYKNGVTKYDSFADMLLQWRVSTGKTPKAFIEELHLDDFLTEKQFALMEVGHAAAGPLLASYMTSLCPDTIHVPQYFKKIATRNYLNHLVSDSRNNEHTIVDIPNNKNNVETLMLRWLEHNPEANYVTSMTAMTYISGNSHRNLIDNGKRTILSGNARKTIDDICTKLDLSEPVRKQLIERRFKAEFDILANDKNNFAKSLKAIRDITGLTREQLRQAIGVSGAVISTWERNLYLPSEKQIQAITLTLGVDDNIDGEWYRILRSRCFAKELAILANDKSNFGMSLKAIRNMKGLEQKELGEAVGVSETIIVAWAHNRSRPSDGKVQEVALALEIDDAVNGKWYDTLRNRCFSKELAILADEKSKFGECLKAIRKIKGLEQKELGEAVGVSDSVIYHWEKNNPRPSEKQLQAIILRLGADEEQTRILTQHHQQAMKSWVERTNKRTGRRIE